MNDYDIGVDFASMADDGTLWTQSSNVHRGRSISPGDVVTVGSEDAVPARASVVSVEGDAIVLKVIGDEATVAQSE